MHTYLCSYGLLLRNHYTILCKTPSTGELYPQGTIITFRLKLQSQQFKTTLSAPQKTHSPAFCLQALKTKIYKLATLICYWFVMCYSFIVSCWAYISRCYQGFFREICKDISVKTLPGKPMLMPCINIGKFKITSQIMDHGSVTGAVAGKITIV